MSTVNRMDNDFMQLLLENSTLKYHVIYHKFFYNHTSQTLVALKFLGGNKIDLDNFLKWYTNELFDANKYRLLEETSEFEGLDEKKLSEKIKNIRGQKAHFYFLVSYFEKLLKDKYNGDLEKLVANEYVKNDLYTGLLGSAFHSMIQIGYGLAVKHARIVCEGLAFAVCGYFGLDSDKQIEDIGCGHKDIISVLNDIKFNNELNSYLREECHKQQESIVEKGKFATFLKILYESRQDKLLEYAKEVGIQFPKENQESFLTQFLDSLLELTIALFVRSEAICDFFFLHGVTSVWALKQIILKVHRDIELKDVHMITKVFLCSLLAVYLARNTPGLKSVFEVKQDLQINDRSWNEIIKDTLSGIRDEHVYKLVMTCWNTDLSINNGTEPKDDCNITKMAAEIAIKYNLFFD